LASRSRTSIPRGQSARPTLSWGYRVFSRFKGLGLCLRVSRFCAGRAACTDPPRSVAACCFGDCLLHCRHPCAWTTARLRVELKQAGRLKPAA
jgi:hypothetical protein